MVFVSESGQTFSTHQSRVKAKELIDKGKLQDAFIVTRDFDTEEGRLSLAPEVIKIYEGMTQEEIVAGKPFAATAIAVAHTILAVLSEQESARGDDHDQKS